jgi:signal transduction histidine kinase
MRGAVVEFTARHTAEQALAAERDRTQTLARRLLAVQEQERRQLAHELHDQLGQSLTALKLGAQALQRLASPPLEERLAGLVETATRALGETRTLSLQLRPPLLDDFGLIPALHWLLEQHENCGVELSLDGDLSDFRTAPEIETSAFRIAQESVTNALRHAGAKRIALRVTRPTGLLRIEIDDDGRGFEVAAVRARISREGSSLGLLGLDERARLAGGHLDLLSAPGEGTRIVAEFPLPPTP